MSRIAWGTRSKSPVSEPTRVICPTPDDTFAFGEHFAASLESGDVVLLKGTLGAGKTLLTQGMVSALGYDVDEVTSPSFALVNLYHTEKFNIYHIDLWRIEGDAAFAVGLEDILEDRDAIVVIEWAERLGPYNFRSRVFEIEIRGDGDDARTISVATFDKELSEPIAQ
jgi:tRNA threonylcarbamoyladenosine biosynthesis protein TsaE